MCRTLGVGLPNYLFELKLLAWMTEYTAPREIDQDSGTKLLALRAWFGTNISPSHPYPVNSTLL